MYLALESEWPGNYVTKDVGVFFDYIFAEVCRDNNVSIVVGTVIHFYSRNSINEGNTLILD